MISKNKKMLKRTLSSLFSKGETPVEQSESKRVYSCRYPRLNIDENILSKDYTGDEISIVHDVLACLNALFDPVDGNETTKRPSIHFESANSSRSRGISVFFSSMTPIIVDVNRLCTIYAGLPPGTKVKLTHTIPNSKNQLIFTVYFK